MSKISDKLNIINDAKNDIKTAIENKGVSVGDIGIQDYADKINEMKIATPVTKGIIINEYDSDGYATDVSILGLTSIPSYCCYYWANQPTSYFGKLNILRIGEGATSVGSYAFGRNDYAPKIVVLPSTIKSITGSYPFRYSTVIEKLVIKAITPPTINNNTFNYSTEMAIYVPDESVSAYQTATNWSTYASQIKPISELEGVV